MEIDATVGKIYWVQGDAAIMRANLDGSSIETIVSASSFTLIRAIALDVAHGHLYYVERSSRGTDWFKRANLNGTSRSDLFAAYPGYSFIVTDLAYDPTTGYSYWLTTNLNNSVNRAFTNGSNRETLVSSAGAPREMALDLTNGKIYWTSNETSSSIRRANLDGSDHESLVSGISTAYGFDLDVVGGKMYWANSSSTGSIQRANLDGTSIETLIPTLGPSSSQALQGLALVRFPPLLDIPDDLAANPATTVDVPLVFAGHGNNISAVDLTLSYPTICLIPDLTDANTDGIPDNFVLNQSGFQIGVDSADAANGSIQIVISADANTDPVSTFADGALLTVPFDVVLGCSGPVSIDLSATSWGDSSGQSVDGETEGGIVTVNGAPSAEDDFFTIGEDDGSLTGNLFVNNGAGADSDPDGDTLIVAAVNGSVANVGQTINLGDATVTVQGDGSLPPRPACRLRPSAHRRASISRWLVIRRPCNS